MWSNDRFSIINTTMWSTFATRFFSASSLATTVFAAAAIRPSEVGVLDAAAVEP